MVEGELCPKCYLMLSDRLVLIGISVAFFIKYFFNLKVFLPVFDNYVLYIVLLYLNYYNDIPDVFKQHQKCMSLF